MKANFEHTTFPSGGGQLKVAGALTISCSASFLNQLLTLIPGNGNYLLSLRDVIEIDVTAMQMIWSIRKRFLDQNRRLIVSWPQHTEAKRLLHKTGLFDSMQS